MALRMTKGRWKWWWLCGCCCSMQSKASTALARLTWGCSLLRFGSIKNAFIQTRRNPFRKCRIAVAVHACEEENTKRRLVYISTRGETPEVKEQTKTAFAQETAAHRAPRGRRERTAGSGRTRPLAPGRRSGRRQKGRLESVALSARTRTAPFCRTVDPRHQITWQISWCEPRAASEEAFRGRSCDKIKPLRHHPYKNRQLLGRSILRREKRSI